MISVSSDFKEYIKHKDREMHLKLSITYIDASGESKTDYLTENEVNVSTMKISHQSLSSGILGFGSVSSKTLSFTLQNKNGEYDGCSFKDSQVDVQSGLLVSDGIEYVGVGKFYIQSAGQPLNTIKIEAVDKISTLSKKYNPSVGFPCPISSLISDFESQSGININGVPDEVLLLTIGNDWDTTPIVTYQDIIGAIAEICGGFAYMDYSETIQIKCFSDLQDSTNAYTVGENDMRISSEFYNESHKITGITYSYYDDYLHGTDEYCIPVSENVLISSMSDSDKNTVIENLYNKYKDFVYMPFDCNMRYDPSLEIGDPVLFTNIKTKSGIVDILSFIGNISSTINSNIQINTPDTDEVDLENEKMSDKTYSTSGGGGTTEEVKDNILLLSCFNRATLPELCFNPSKTLTQSNNIESWSSMAIISSSSSSATYANQFLLPFKGMKSAKYTLSIYCRRTYTSASATNGVCYWRVLDIKNGQLYRANERISGSTQTITINNTTWEWISFTFTGREIELGAIQLQMYANAGSSTASGNYNYEVLLALAVLEEGTSFTGYRESPYEKLCINGKEPTAKVADNLFIQTCGAQCCLPFAYLTNAYFQAGASTVVSSKNDSVFHASRHWAAGNDTNSMLDSGNATGIDIMTRDSINVINSQFTKKDISQNCLTYAKINSDSENNINITCNSLTVNGKTVLTSE